MDTETRRQRFHQRVINVLQVLVAPIVKRVYAFRTETVKGIEGPFLLLANHVTAVDPILICTSFRQQMYIVASEHLMQKGFGSQLLRFFFDPIVRRKGDTAVTTVKQMLARLKAGCNVCVFPEGTCSYDGTNPPFLPTIGKVAKAAKVSLITYRFEGGYFTLPRWGRGIRRGDYYGHAVQIYTPDALRSMSDAEINAHIREDLCENAYARQSEHPVAYKSRRRAEYLESAFFLCPNCKGVGTLKTRGDAIRCSCGLSGMLDEHYRLSGLPFVTLPEWDAFENDWLKEVSQNPDFSFSDKDVTLWKNDDLHRKLKLQAGTMRITRDRFSIGDRSFALSEISDMELVRRNLLVFSTPDAHYQASGQITLNARKYMQLYRIWKGTNL